VNLCFLFLISLLPVSKSPQFFLSLFIDQYQTRWSQLFAGSVVAALPTMIVFGFHQKYFIKGLTSGAVKQ